MFEEVNPGSQLPKGSGSRKKVSGNPPRSASSLAGAAGAALAKEAVAKRLRTVLI